MDDVLGRFKVILWISGGMAVVIAALISTLGLLRMALLLVGLLAIGAGTYGWWKERRSPEKVGQSGTAHMSGSVSLLKIPGPSNLAASRLLQFTTANRAEHHETTGGRPVVLRLLFPVECTIRSEDLPLEVSLGRKKGKWILKRFTDEGVAFEERSSGVEIRAEVYLAEDQQAKEEPAGKDSSGKRTEDQFELPAAAGTDTHDLEEVSPWSEPSSGSSTIAQHRQLRSGVIELRLRNPGPLPIGSWVVCEVEDPNGNLTRKTVSDSPTSISYAERRAPASYRAEYPFDPNVDLVDGEFVALWHRGGLTDVFGPSLLASDSFRVRGHRLRP